MADVMCEEDYFFHWQHKEITTGLPKQLEIEPSTTAPYVARENLAQRCAWKQSLSHAVQNVKFKLVVEVKVLRLRNLT